MFNETASKVLEALAQGKSLRAAAAEAGIHHSTVQGWLDDSEKEEFARQYALTRARAYQMLGDEIMEIADGPGDPATKRLQFDARRWMLSKMLPKVYGDKIEHEHTGGVTLQVSSQDERL